MRRFLLVVAVAGCGGSSSKLDHLIESATIECGTLAFDNLQDTCPDTAAALQCFFPIPEGGVVDRPHVEQVFVTEEGDPIYEHFFVDDDASLVLIRDTRADDFGPKEITTTACADVVMSDATAGGCRHLVCAP